MISINVTPTVPQPPEGSVSSAVVNDKIDKKIESFKTETFDAPLVTAPVGDEVIPVKRPDESFGTIQINQLGSGTSTGSIIEATYDELVSLADSGKLIPGQKYRMIDYETAIEKDGIRSAGHPFDLIVTASSKTTLNKKCSAAHSIRDIDGYFLNSDLSSWEIYYTLDSSLYSHVPMKGKGVVLDLFGGEEYSMYYLTLMCKQQSDGTFLWSGMLNAKDIAGVTLRMEIITSDETFDSVISGTMCVLEENMCETVDSSMIGEIPIVKEFNNDVGGKGYIYRLTDEFNNSCPYDFKNVQYLVSLKDTSYGRMDETNLSNGWQFNYTNEPDASDQWVYTFNRQDFKHEYHDVSLNYDQGYLTCTNNYMYDSDQLPKNIILTSDEVAVRGSDGAPEAERVMNNNYFGDMCVNNIFNICSDTTFKMSAYNYGTRFMNNTLENVVACVFGTLTSYSLTNNNSFYSCDTCTFIDCENNQIKYTYDFKTSYFRDNIVDTIRDVYGIKFEGCHIKNLTNVKNDKVHFYMINCTLNIKYATINNLYKYETFIYDSNINGQYCDLQIYNSNNSTNRYNLDVILCGSNSKRINHSFKDDTGLKYIKDYRTYVRAKTDGTVYEYTDLDLFNQGGSSAVVEALNTEI